MGTDLVQFLLGLWHNAPLMAAVTAILVGQLAKVPLHYVLYREWDLHKVIDAGGMPSSHAAGAAALTVALAYVVGPQSPVFATAVVFAVIVMYDAGGIRRHAGEHAVLLNRLAMELAESGIAVQAASTVREGERLKEILGHEPREVVVGAILGAVVGAVFGKWW
ncbi:divergent PAP2 family protein [Alicyclobacillus sp.]|uniref:divergent PAP2 family protein n=1 Tax=Alicyclobacillus sp. TaxID=61169 RepID=UPI0025BAE6F3|nr:divergent PAP2 family protein [Alicyclobacillus sp.]MCL6515428.1 divergent PAP2 family protein [Alicyclobacillus sp.]